MEHLSQVFHLCSAHPDSNLNTLNNSRAAFESKQTSSPGYFVLHSYTSIICLVFEYLFQPSFHLKTSSIHMGGGLLASLICMEGHSWRNLKFGPVPSNLSNDQLAGQQLFEGTFLFWVLTSWGLLIQLTGIWAVLWP